MYIRKIRLFTDALMRIFIVTDAKGDSYVCDIEKNNLFQTFDYIGTASLFMAGFI